MLDAGIPVCQRAAAGLGMNDFHIKLSNQPHSVEDCFNIMFPHDCFNHVIDLTNANLPVSVRKFTKHEFMQCIGVLLTTALVNPGNIKNLWNTLESRLVPPFHLKERFGWDVIAFRTGNPPPTGCAKKKRGCSKGSMLW